jgi:hypothetical protein
MAVKLELRCDLAALPVGISKFNKFLYAAHCHLRMVNQTTGKEFGIEPYDPTEGMLVMDDGSELVPLHRHAVIEMPVEFPLRTAGAGMNPGEYKCWVDYSTQRMGNANPKTGTDVWAGNVQTGKTFVQVVPEVPSYQTILVPRVLRVDGDGEIRLRSADAEKVKVSVGNGMFLATLIKDGEGNLGSIQGGPPVMDTANAIGSVKGLPAGKKRVIEIEVVESAEPPHHFWFPVGTTLWKKTFEVIRLAPAASQP